MKRILISTLFVVVTSICGFGQAAVTHTVTINIQNKVDIRVKPSTTLNTNFSLETVAEQEEGKEILQAGIFQVQATNNWLVQAKSTSPQFSYAGSEPSVVMSTSLLKIKNSNATDFLSLSDEGVVLVNGYSGDYESNEFGIDYKFEPNSLYPPGVYSLDIALTVSNP
ncbi:hypothetical protein SAMN06298216_0968 [Spirosomataceae bacterium TFI 002]|nr:hypothetical protein SAMN06298216_0968 [Spirosomataceae bacterium TFI 002]